MTTSRLRLLLCMALVSCCLLEQSFPQPQSATWDPDGCTLAILPDFPGKSQLQNAANLILAGICNSHDICYRNCAAAWALG